MPYFTIFKETLVQPFQLDKVERVFLENFLRFLEESHVGVIIEKAVKKYNNLGRPSYDPYRFFATIIYAFSKNKGSVRDIEESIKFDIRFMYLMDYMTPSYVTIAKYIKEVIVPNQKEIFTTIMKHLVSKFEIDIRDMFLDGTKIEANANKYKFVWKPTKFDSKLNENICALLSKHFTLSNKKKTFSSFEIATYVTQLLSKIQKKKIDITKIKIGRGHRIPEIVKDYNKLNSYMLKKLEYEEKINICGPNRNSYFKTDYDATAMTIKEDYYSGLGSNTRAAYNYQLLVSKGIILNYYVCQERNDYYTLVPILSDYFKYYGCFPLNLCADSGYGSEFNYKFLEKNKINNYVKFGSWQGELSGKSPALYTYKDEDGITCFNGKKGVEVEFAYGRKAKTGSKFYKIDECIDCPIFNYCRRNLSNKESPSRLFEVSISYIKNKQIALKNLLSPKGIEMRINRSAQVEGAIGVLKQNMDYTRARRRGLDDVSGEFMLVVLGYNIKKYTLLVNNKAKLNYWIAPANLEAEKLPTIKVKTVNKTKKKPEGVNEASRVNYSKKARSSRKRKS